MYICKMIGAQAPHGKFMSHSNLFLFSLLSISEVWKDLSLTLFLSGTKDRARTICVIAYEEEAPCCQQVIHTSRLMDWYQSQQQRHLRPSCPFCRGESPMTVLVDLANKPERVPPLERR